MDAHALFSNIREIRGELMRLEQREAYARLSMLPGAIRYDKDHVMSSPEDPMGKFAERISDLEERTRKRYDKLLNYNILAEQILYEMPTAKYRMLIELRYIEGGFEYRHSWEDVASIMGYDEHYIRVDMRRKAMEEAQEVLEKLPQTTTDL